VDGSLLARFVLRLVQSGRVCVQAGLLRKLAHFDPEERGQNESLTLRTGANRQHPALIRGQMAPTKAGKATISKAQKLWWAQYRITKGKARMVDALCLKFGVDGQPSQHNKSNSKSVIDLGGRSP
jgi:hypothetical protein